jgi:hypothetical protein
MTKGQRGFIIVVKSRVVSGIRNGVPFPIIRSPECQSISNQIAENNAAIIKIKAKYSKRVLIMTADKSPTRKPIWVQN